MLHIPVLRGGKPYESMDKVTIGHYATGDPVAVVSQANSGLVVRDIHRINDRVLEDIPMADLIAMCHRAAELFATAELPIGDQSQSFDDYVHDLCATTGMPIAFCRNNADKVRRVMAEIETVLAGLTRGFDLSILDKGYGSHEGHVLSFYRAGRVFGAVLPSNSPGVHGLWVPAVALKAPLILKPGREEPWTPYRVIEAFCAAGIPRKAFGFYPTDHAGASELLRNVHRSMLFGGGPTTAPWVGDPRVEIHGPGYSKVLLGDDCADDWEKYVDLMAGSIAANGGRSCINASSVWTPRHGREIAEALAERFAKVRPLPADDENASLAAFANRAFAEQISAAIDYEIAGGGATDVTEKLRGAPRLATQDGCTYLMPTIVHCESIDHGLANKEYLFPFASVVECPTAQMPEAIGPSLIVSAITADVELKAALMAASNVDRLNIGAVPTFKIAWDQPHEGNLFTHLYRQRAFQIEHAA